uniref:NACHT domain-containing protein n=1 Tax=Cyanothece sp. (strain PCC 7425 / ATCC 29141) TaxID=395961 RepID=B8HS68_CYAP4
MNQPLVNALRKLSHSGQSGFEGLIAKLLEILTEKHFHLAQTGTQLGRDISSSSIDADVIAVECKRYGKDSELDEEELLGKIVRAAKSIPDLDLWVLVTSRDVHSLLDEALRSTANDYGITYLAISTGDGTPSSLEVLCAQAINQVVNLLESQDETRIRQSLIEIAKPTQFNQKVEQLRNELTSPLVGYNSWKIEQNRFFLQCLQSETESRKEFGQPINVEEEGVRLIKREAAWIHLDKWLNEWKATRQPLAVLGEEGDGKTWGVASWVSHKLKNVDDFPPVIFLSSTEINEDEPEGLISKAIARHLHGLEKEQWKKRVERWTKRAVSHLPLFLMVLDGINERWSPQRWRTLLERFAGRPWTNQVAILLTCRAAYWQRHFEPLSHLQFLTYTLPSYNDRELDKALAHHNLQRSDIQNDLLTRIRKPRYFDLMVRYREKVAETGDVTDSRLIYEDWRDRLGRKRNISLDDITFREFICQLARKFQDGTKYISEQDVEYALPSCEGNKQSTLEELRTGGVLQSGTGGYKVDKKRLIYGFGLLLVDQVEEASESSEDLSEAIAKWLEPHAGMDIKAAICEFAAIHALSLRDYPKPAKIALLQTWIYCQNPEQTAESNFIAYLPIDPQCYLELAEIVWSDAAENAWAQELLMQAFLRRREPSILSQLNTAFERWLGFVHIYGVPSLRSYSGEGNEWISQEIIERLGSSFQIGQRIALGSYTIIAIEDDGLLRLGRVALAVISRLPRGMFLHAIATGCLAEAIMGIPSKYDLFTWLFRSSPEPIWEKVHEEVNKLLAIERYCAQQAAYRLLSFEGGPEAHQLKQDLPQDLVPVNPNIEQHRQDPCNSWFQWNQVECEACLLRSDLSPEQIAGNLKRHCINPDLSVPNGFGQRLHSLTEAISIEKVRAILQADRDDYTLDDYEPVLCAYAPDAIVDLIRRITRHVKEREGLALHYLVFRLSEYSLIFQAKEQESIYSAWTSLLSKSNAWDDKEKVTEAFLFKLILKAQTAEEQLLHFIQRPEDAIDLLAFRQSFPPINDWSCVSQHLELAASTRTIQRILWFLSTYPKTIHRDVVNQFILPFLKHEDSMIRGTILQILYFFKDEKIVESFINGEWAWQIDKYQHWQETHWGSLILCEYATHLPYSNLRHRVHPNHWGYAVQRRGMIDEEVKQYSEDLQNIWVSLNTKIPDLPVETPSLSITASISEREDLIMLHQVKISDNRNSQRITFLSREASWGGLDRGGSQEWEELMSPNASEQRQRIQSQTTNEIIKQQIAAGNIWFAQRVFVNTLCRIISSYPHLMEQWLNPVLTGASEGRRYLCLGYSFYEALCTVLLQIDPTRGLLLYWRLQNSEIKTDIRDEHSDIRLLDYALFQTHPSEDIKHAWQRKLGECKTDGELLEIAILAQCGNSFDWLWDFVMQEVESSSTLKQSRAIVLLAFIQERKALEHLNTLLENQPDGWMKDLLEYSRQHWQRNNWAMHWYRCCLNTRDDVTAWTSFRLFLQCVDTRFWFWRQQVEVEYFETDFYKNFSVFLKDNLDTIKNRIKTNEKTLREKYLGHKILVGQAYPWMLAMQDRLVEVEYDSSES